jgi:hypothetical protein
VFGKYADTVVKQSRRADTQLGLSANSYRESANLIGSLFRNQGVAADQLAGKTRGMIKTGADLAATYGGTTAQAVEALGSAFKGEFDPLERYGISIKQSAINAELAARGQDKLTGSALKAAQQQATSRLVLEQSSRTVGAFGKESDTLANRQQVLGAQFTNLEAKVGKGLTPALTRLGTAVIDHVMPGLSRLAGDVTPKIAHGLDQLSTSIPGIIRGFSGGGPKAGQFGDSLDSMAGSARQLGPPVVQLVHSLPSLNDVLGVTATVMQFAADHTDLLRKALPFLVAGYVAVKAGQLAANVAALAGVPLKVAEIAVNRQLITSNRELIASRAGDTVATVENSAAQSTGVLTRVRSIASMVAQRVATVAVSAATKAYAAGQWLLNAALTANPIGLVIVGLAALAAGVIIAWKKSDEFRKVVTGAWNGIRQATAAVFPVVRTIIVGVFKVVSTAVRLYVTTYVTIIRTGFNVIRAVTTTVFGAVKTIVSGALRLIGSVVRTNIAVVRTVVTGAWGAIRGATSTAWGAISGVVRTAISGVVQLVTGLPGKISGVFKGAGTMLADEGKAIIGGLISGIQSMASSLISTITHFVIDKIPGPVRKALGISSPSRVMRRIGRQTMQGLVQGIRGGGKDLDAAIAKANKAIRDKLGKGAGPVIAGLRGEEKQLRRLSDRYDGLSRRLGKARDQLKALRDAQRDVRQGALDYASIINSTADAGEVTAGSITQGLLERLEAVKAFVANVKRLRESGLNRSALQQIIDAGVEGGSATAAALVAGGNASIKEANKLQRQLDKAAAQLGDEAAKAMHKGGVKAAAGLVSGLESQQAKIERTVRRLGAVIGRAVARANAVAAARARREAARKKRHDTATQRHEHVAATKRVQVPRIGASDTHTRAQLNDAARGRAGAAGRTQISVRLTAEQLSALQRGKAIRADLDVYESHGGRKP